MKKNVNSIASGVLLAIFPFTLLLGICADAQEEVLYHFKANGSDGQTPESNLVFDAAGNLYSTTYSGGTYDDGTVFELSPASGGRWTEKVLYSFNIEGTGGARPSAGLVLDASGNLYGTTSWNSGVVFELSPTSKGEWTEHVLHSFGSGTDGYGTNSAGVIFDSAGNLYGTTFWGGTGNCGPKGLPGCGTVFELTPAGDGSWTETILHNFEFNGIDGLYPVAALVIDGSGNLYGTTSGGGAYNWGTAFEMKPEIGGGWSETVIHSFNENGKDGADPAAGLTLDTVGNLHGTTMQGGSEACVCGTVFALTHQTGGSWSERISHSFNNNGKDGSQPQSGLILDMAGNLYGTTRGGGPSGNGTVFELSPEGAEKLLADFSNNEKDGVWPYAGLIFDTAGNLYGTTSSGGGDGATEPGTVFEIKRYGR
jgi:uncharacterized repeat protein (TIGR03803 family)